MNTLAEQIRQYETHNELTQQAVVHGGLVAQVDLDAIIVPASRTAAHLDQAITLARAADCWLLILCSRELRGADAARQLAARSYRKAIVIELPASYSHEWFRFPRLSSLKEGLPPEHHLYNTDLSLKRNVGLVMARMLGWRHVFFLDDDIRDVSHLDLQSTVNMLGSFAAAGLWITEYPDNSVVCHANRVTGGSQDVFVSGAALAVDTAADIGFFPDVYNEDWLFFYDYAAERRLANSFLRVTQLTYDPFGRPRRAAWQEFGDVLAEGLYALLHLGMTANEATAGYWWDFLEARRSFLEEVLDRAECAPLENHGYGVHRGQMVHSVKWALKCLQTIQPDLCEQYVHGWREDLDGWRQRMARIGGASAEEALGELGLASTGRIYHSAAKSSHKGHARPVTTAGGASLPRFETLNRMLGRGRPLGLTPPCQA